MKTTDAKRCTGRTYRMVREAVEQALSGRAVYILVVDLGHKRWVEGQVRSIYAENFPSDLPVRISADHTVEQLGIRVVTEGSLGYIPDLRSPRPMLGAHPNCLLFVDHHYIEVKYGWVIDAWTRYDVDSSNIYERTT